MTLGRSLRRSGIKFGAFSFLLCTAGTAWLISILSDPTRTVVGYRSSIQIRPKLSVGLFSSKSSYSEYSSLDNNATIRQREMEMAIGKAADTIRKDYPNIFKCCHANLQKLLKLLMLLVCCNSSQRPGISSLRDADATRLVIALSARLPQGEMLPKGSSALDEILRLPAPDMASSTLPLICGCSITKSLTSSDEFGYLLKDKTQPLYSRCMLLLRRVAAFFTIYEDFISLLRFMASPMLCTDPEPGRIQQLSVITSVTQSPSVSDAVVSQERRSHEANICKRLETLCIIAERGDPVPRCILGGESLNTVALYMQQTPISGDYTSWRRMDG